MLNMLHSTKPNVHLMLPAISEFSCISLPYPLGSTLKIESKIKEFITKIIK